MPRTPSEATRFTSTQPNAQKPASSTVPLPTSSAPANETPQQKVTRLRDAARRAKLDQETRWDRIVLRGRVWADRAHKVTATGLIVASSTSICQRTCSRLSARHPAVEANDELTASPLVIATGFACISFGDMIIANRQKKHDWYEQQNAAYDRAIRIANQAEIDGTLTSDLALFLNKERAVEQAEAEKAAAGTIWQRTKRRIFKGLKMENRSAEEDVLAQRTVLHASGNQDGIRNAESSPAEQAPQKTIPSTSAPPENARSPSEDPAEALHVQGREQSARAGVPGVASLVEASPVPKATAEDSRIVESRAPRRGGPLDRMGEQTSTSISQLANGLLGRFRGS